MMTRIERRDQEGDVPEAPFVVSEVAVPSRARRVVLVTLGLSVAGALFGAVASAVAGTVWLWSASVGVFVDALVVAASVGGALGAVLGPAAGWLLLRRVPLGVAVIGTTLGATLGGAIGAVTGAQPIVTAVAGFILAAVGLRWRYGYEGAGVSRRRE
jgi:hypothetical protein